MDLNNKQVNKTEKKSTKNNQNHNKTPKKDQENRLENENQQNSITSNNTNNFNDTNKEKQDEEYEILFARNDKIFYAEYHGFNIHDEYDENFNEENYSENNDYYCDENEYYGENNEEKYDNKNKYYDENKEDKNDFYDDEYHDGYEEKDEYYKTDDEFKENFIEDDDKKNECVSKKEDPPKYKSVEKGKYEIRKIKREPKIRYTYKEINEKAQKLYEDYKCRYEAINEELNETIRVLTKEMENLTCNYFRELNNLQNLYQCAFDKKFYAGRR